MTIKYILCDWDETLVHTLPVITNAYNFTLKSLGLKEKKTDEIKKITSGKSKTEVFNSIFPKKHIDEAMSLFYRYIEDNHLKDIYVIDGAIKFLEYCRFKKIKVYIISSKAPKYLESELRITGIFEFIDGFYGTPSLKINGNKNLEKPNRDVFVKLFEGNPPPAEECCVIGDGEADKKLAQNIGCQCILINPKLENGVENLYKAITKLDKNPLTLSL